MASDLGQSIKFVCGTLLPKLGKARKICKPLPINTKSEIVLRHNFRAG